MHSGDVVDRPFASLNSAELRGWLDIPLLAVLRVNSRQRGEMSKTATILMEEEEDDDNIEMEPEVDDEPPIKKAPKKRAPPAPKAKKAKKVVAVVEEEEEEEEEEAAAAAVVAKKPRQRHAPRAQGSRFGRTPSYRTQLARDRIKHREEQIKAGRSGAIAHKNKPGTVAKREAEYLRKHNGMYVSSALVRRKIDLAIAKMVPILQAENECIKARLERRGKPVPAHLTIANAEDWAVCPGTVQLYRGAVQLELELHGEITKMVTDHAKRVTTSARDTELADLLLKKYGA